MNSKILKSFSLNLPVIEKKFLEMSQQPVNKLSFLQTNNLTVHNKMCKMNL